MFGKGKGKATKRVEMGQQSESLGKNKSRRAKLLKPSSKKKTPTSDVIVVSIPNTFVKNELLQSTRTLPLSKKVVGKDINIPVTGLNNSVVVYNVNVTNGTGDEWKLEKTFTDFYQLHQMIKSRFPSASQVISSFPKKKMFNPNINSPVIEYRKKFFQAYLQALLQMKPRLHFINDFLELNNHVNTSKKKELSIEDFEILKLLGKGSFGKVFLVRVVGSKEIYAMKVLNKNEVKKRRQIEHTKTEMRVMGGAAHPFIVSLCYAFTSEQRLFMVSEFCQGGELFFHLKQMRCFTTEMVRFYSAEISLALNYLHEKDIIYRDIKPENVLLDKDGHIKVTDFGLSRENVSDPQGATTFCGTPEYLSPEMLLGRRNGYGYGKSVDWWGLGVLMYEMFFGWPPFYDSNKKVMCRKIVNGKVSFNSRTNKIGEEAKNIIRSFLTKDPEQRLGISGNGFPDVKAHVFFDGIDFDILYEKKLDPPFKPKITNATGNFDAEFTDQSNKISDHEQEETPFSEDGEQEEEEDVFEDFNFSRDAFWDQ